MIINEFELHSRNYGHIWTNTLGKGMNSLIPPAMGYIALLLSFYRDGFSIEYSKKVDMPLNKKTEPISIKPLGWLCKKNEFFSVIDINVPVDII